MKWYHNNGTTYPCPIGNQVRVLMYSKDWSSHIDGLYDNLGDQPRWFCYNPEEDRFSDWPEPDWFMLIELPELPE